MALRKTLVTGGAGFIGSNLCRKLLEQGRDVVVIDNLSSGLEAHVDMLRDYGGSFEFIEGDVADPATFEGLDDVYRIYDLACPASPPFYQADPIGTMKTSILGAVNALELARRTGARVLLTSTSEVYGEPLEHPQRESYRGNVNSIGIRSCYDEGKRAAETLFFDYARTYGVDVRVVRLFNTYGPGMRPDDGRVIPNFIRQALAGEDLTVYGDGTQTRSFCYVGDSIAGIIAMMEREGFAGPVNLGNPGEYTMRELARMVLDCTGSKSKLVYLDLPADDPTRRKPDVTLAREKLGWVPHVPLEVGIVRTIEYFERTWL